MPGDAVFPATPEWWHVACKLLAISPKTCEDRLEGGVIMVTG